MPGGAAAIRQPWRMAAAYLDAAGGPLAGLDVARRNEASWAPAIQLARRGINAPLTSSAGRLFDAVAAVLGVRDAINYEGQAAVELEQLADTTERGSYRARIRPGPPVQVAGADLVRAVADDLIAGTSRAVIAARFQNLLLCNEVIGRLTARGFDVLVHSQVPCNDGGISLGQAVVAGARDAAGQG
jgi:hydrogenase maturation protein HypF